MEKSPVYEKQHRAEKVLNWVKTNKKTPESQGATPGRKDESRTSWSDRSGFRSRRDV